MDDAVEVRPALAWARGVIVEWGSWVRAHLGVTILLSILAFGFGWVWNTYVMAVNLDGSEPLPDERTIATASGRPFNALFWLLFFTLLSGLITYGWQRGWRNLFVDLAVLPRRLGESVSRNASGAIAMLLWGMAVALIISTVITSAVSLALGLVLLTLAATPVGTILNFAVVRLWRALAGIVTPTAGIGAILVAGPFLIMVGEAFGLLLDWLLGSLLIGLVLGILAAVGSVLLVRGAKPSKGAAASVLLGLAAVGVPALWASRARADDGGWRECMTDSGESCSEIGLAGIFAWFGSDGATVVIGHAAVGGVGAGVGTMLGVGLGSVAAGLAVAGANAAAAGLGSQASQGKASGRASVPGEHDLPGEQGVPGQQIPQQGGGPQAHGVPGHEVSWEQGAQQGTAGQGQWIPQQGGQPGLYQSGVAESPAAGAPQPPTGTDFGDVLPEPRDRRKKEEGDEQSHREDPRG